MNSKQEEEISALGAKEGFSGPLVNRRRMMESAAVLGVLASFGEGVLGDAQAATDPRNGKNAANDLLLPDGTEFARWEQPLSFSKTYYVDNNSPAADDNGPGDKARPFRTINKAAQTLQPGERVVIASGTYRECVRPARGGTSPSQMISYEAAPGAKVCIKGSDVLKDGWQQETMSTGPRGGAGTGITTWRYDFKPEMFADGYNPFALPSIQPQWVWVDPKVVDMGSFLRRRGLVFADGKPLEPVEQLRELASAQLSPVPDFTVPPVPVAGMPARRRGGPVMQEIGGSLNARFYIEDSGTGVHIRLASGTPADHLIEVTTRRAVFVPAQGGASFIRVKGLTFQHAGNVYPFPQFGMISLAGGDHWIVEDNTIEWANGVGLVIGRDGDSGNAAHAGASHVVRRNTIRYCGIEGLAGMGTTDALIEDNLIEWCCWADAERGWEAAGAKFHRAKNMMFRRNVIRHIRHGNAAWWDSDDANCRITRNVFADVLTVGAALHMEMNRDRNQIDNNIIWNVRNAEPGTPGQRGCAGSGIFDNASDKLVIAQNLIGHCNNSGIFAIVRPDRAGSGTGTDNDVANNIFVKCGKSAIVFLNPNNKADGNAYVDMPKEFQGQFEGTPSPTYDPDAWQHVKYRDLAGWRELHGWDAKSVMADAQIDFDPDTLQLTVVSAKPLPQVTSAGNMHGDLLGKPTGATRVAGPLANLGGRGPWHVDPRVPADK